MTKMKIRIRRRAFGLQEFADTFGISRESAKRFARTGVLKTITVGGRRLVPAAELERVEQEGLGTPRRRSTAQNL
jgi:predicted site-specific integrase-resolvase